jgi:ubiquinone/menaquinone biosynthesis C-methylase UbiE
METGRLSPAAEALAGFPWPAPPGSTGAPVWDQGEFVVGGERRRVLCFPAGDSNWSDELTEMHESVAGKANIIDCVSRELAVRSLQRWLPGNESRPRVVLDVGCSSGYVLEEILRAIPDLAVLGSDYILSPLLGLGRRMPDVPLLQFDLRRCPLPDACVDAVTALNVLEHIEQDDEALASIARVLRPGGIAHIEVPAGPGLFDDYDKHLMHHRRYTMAGLRALARRVGFEVINATHIGSLVYPAFWFVKKRNRRQARGLSPEAEAALVQSQIRQSGESRIVSALMKTELQLGKVINFPIGIRCVVVLRKPSS